MSLIDLDCRGEQHRYRNWLQEKAWRKDFRCPATSRHETG